MLKHALKVCLGIAPESQLSERYVLGELDEVKYSGVWKNMELGVPEFENSDQEITPTSIRKSKI